MTSTPDIERMIIDEFCVQSLKYGMRCDDIRNINAIIHSINPKEKLIDRPYPLACIMCVVGGVYLTRGDYH